MKVAVIGYGVVGSGIVGLLHKNAATIAARAGEQIEVRYILDLRDFPESPYGAKHIKDFNLILADESIGVVMEAIGGINPAYQFTKALLKAGKSVVTSNKELVANKGAELLSIARAHGGNYLFEASVGGAIPIIRPLSACLAANEIYEIEGILNGTTNYILSAMEKGTGSYEQVLQRAKAHGYAEADPSADVLGWDAGRKICILASIAFGKQVYYDKIDIQGIEQIDVEDIRCAALIGGTIKLIAKAGRSSDGKIYANVAPAIVLKDNPLHSVDGVFNAVLVRGDAVGEVMFYGKGAGAYPTASAAVADLIDIVRHDGDARGPYWEDLGDGYTCDGLDMRTDYLLRIKTNSGEAGRQLGALLGADAFSEIETDRAGQLVAKVALTRQKQAVLARIEDEIGPVKALKILS